MKRIKELTLVFSFLIFGISCGNTGGVGAESKLKGKVTGGGSGQTITIEHLLPTEVKVVDSAEIGEDGSFAFENLNVETIGFYRIKRNDNAFITLILTPSDQATIETDWNMGITPYTITGSPESARLQALNNRMAKLFQARDSMNNLFQSNPGNEKLLMQLQQDFQVMADENQAFARDFIREDPSSFACLAAAEQLDPDQDTELYTLVDEKIGAKYPESPYFKEFHKVVAKIGFLAPGTEAPEIVLPNPKGDMVKLSSLRGKVVLVDFWASWCRPCRAENPNVVAAFERFHDKGFEVFGVSLDKERDRWLQAIEDDNLNWTQVSDLKFWNSSVVKLYDIKGIPFAVLLDKDGKIIAKNLRGEALHKKLEEILD